MEENKKRIVWIDTARGLAVIFLIIGHLDIGLGEKWIYSFHVPLFFFLSGLVFNDKISIQEVIRKKFKSLIIPYFTLGIPLLLFYILFLYVEGSSINIIDLVYSFIIQKRFLTIWFLPTLFFLNILFAVMLKVSKKYNFIVLSSLLFVIFGLAYYRHVDWRLIWNIDVCFMAMPFFSIGYICKKEKDKLEFFLLNKKNLIITLFISLLANIVCCIISINLTGDTLSMYSSNYGIVWLSYISAFMGIVFICGLARIIRLKVIEEIGKYSIVYCMWHQTIMLALCNWLFRIFYLDYLFSSGILYIVGIVLKCMFICVLTKITIKELKKFKCYSFICMKE